jgi:hypothetical protein
MRIFNTHWMELSGCLKRSRLRALISGYYIGMLLQ